MEEVIEAILPDRGKVAFPRARLPDDFLSWQSAARLSMFGKIERDGTEGVRMAPAHLPVLASIGDGIFPVNLATRGIGLLPNREYLEEFIREFRRFRNQADDSDFAASIHERVECARRFYSKTEHFNPYILGGLEIFEGQTPKNLRKNPIATLLYTGEAPRYSSYQMNGIVTFVEKGDPHYEYLLAARELFAFDSFHITQHRYPYGYLFHVIEVKNKTPFPRKQ